MIHNNYNTYGIRIRAAISAKAAGIHSITRSMEEYIISRKCLQMSLQTIRQLASTPDVPPVKKTPKQELP